MVQHPKPKLKPNRTDPVTNHQQKEEHFATEGYESNGSDDDNAEWEDEEIHTSQYQKTPLVASKSPRTGGAVKTSLRKRKKAIQTIRSNKETNLPSTSPSPKSELDQQDAKEENTFISYKDMQNAAKVGLFSTGKYLYEISATVFRLLRPLFSLLVVLLVLSFIIGRISSTLYSTFYPICYIPGISSSPICRPLEPVIPTAKKQAKWPDFPKLVEVQSKTFEQLLSESIGGPALSMELQSAQMATKDLAVLVKHSSLSSKDKLVGILKDIASDAKVAADQLGRLTAKVGGSVDNIMAANDWALSRIEEARANEPSPWSLRGTVPWMKPKYTLHEVITTTFDDAMDVMSRQMERLITEAGSNLQNLNVLEERLTTFYDVYHRENIEQSAAKEEVLAELWTILGGNRDRIRNFNDNLELLKGLATYKKEAMAHVVATLMALRDMRDEMEDMRERVAAPHLLGENVPVEVHIKSIKLGLERLKVGRIEAREQEKMKSHEVASKRGL
ncbi:hypothetical protein JR316_0005855 [Psilocybe cubensis]|uniref:Uncharacterized protein n=2 Tax=Psilocybe cubensis TaxID=181762 RepID=A0ACB8H0L5_PSICU|nr:hypothetical protein JR316_0005855 [Psilocybe cubensis]KAH9481333.1 hypothetical protein JR316_0005855 [Psilocybe cubensis]